MLKYFSTDIPGFEGSQKLTVVTELARPASAGRATTRPRLNKAAINLTNNIFIPQVQVL